MYVQDKWVIKDSIEYEIKWYGKFGAKGEKRGKKRKATPEIIKKQNQKNREKNMRRLIKANFGKGDLWVTLKYTKGTRKPTEEVKKDLRRFLDTMRRRYKSHNVEFKFIYRIEIGRLGGIHIHMIVPKISEADTLVILQEAWPQGRVYGTPLDDGEYGELASYIVKQPDEEITKQLAKYEPKERKEYVKYSASRNLVRPVAQRKEYKTRTVRRMLKEGIKPSEGFYVVKDSVRIFSNAYTGMSHIHYTERKVKGG